MLDREAQEEREADEATRFVEVQQAYEHLTKHDGVGTQCNARHSLPLLLQAIGGGGAAGTSGSGEPDGTGTGVGRAEEGPRAAPEPELLRGRRRGRAPEEVPGMFKARLGAALGVGTRVPYATRPESGLVPWYRDDAVELAMRHVVFGFVSIFPAYDHPKGTFFSAAPPG